MTFAAYPDFALFEAKMRREGLADIVINNFHYYYNTLAAGLTGMIPESTITPVDALPRYNDITDYADAGRAAASRVAVLKLNGGLGTSMGLEKAKSLLPVRDRLSFLDLIIRQTLYLRQELATSVPLLFMNSFSTDADTQAVLSQYPALYDQRVPPTLLQNKVPKVLRDSLQPAQWPDNPELEWCPPGHGEVYVALHISGLLQQLLEHGYTHLFLSNADNLGATLDMSILGYIVEQRIPFLIEVAARSDADKKGGHLAQRDGQLLLREIAQCPIEDLVAFQDTARHRFFNTNNLWIDLRVLAEVLAANGHVVKLPMIRNQKTVDPRDPDSPAVYQLESAMGAAIEVFHGAQALVVERDRFLPVKTCSDLLALRSDIYSMQGDFHVRPNPARQLAPISIELDPVFYKVVDDFEQRFPNGAPSLIDCAELTILGDVVVDSSTAFRGRVKLSNTSGLQHYVMPGTTLADQRYEV